MLEGASPLSAWESYYVIVGSSAAALTGLQFVVIALISDLRRRSSGGEIDAFGTPTVVHFCVALLLSATLSAPWDGLGGAAAVLAVAGVAGFAYTAIVVRRTRRQTGYQPVLEDWLWHALFPFAAYGTITASAAFLVRRPHGALFAIAAATLLLVFDGIHNAWDTVTFLITTRDPDAPEGAPEPIAAPRPPAAVSAPAQAPVPAPAQPVPAQPVAGERTR